MLRDFDTAHGLNHVIFRYFNVAGADPEAEVGEFHRPETHLIPLMLDAIDGRRDALTIHGTDYDTPDGTCIRDYVHVMDLVEAHVLGLEWLQAGKRQPGLQPWHRQGVLGARGGRAFRRGDQPRGAGDRGPSAAPATATQAGLGLLARGARTRLDARRSTLDEMISDAWRWHQTGHYRA